IHAEEFAFVGNRRVIGEIDGRNDLIGVEIVAQNVGFAANNGVHAGRIGREMKVGKAREVKPEIRSSKSEINSNETIWVSRNAKRSGRIKVEFWNDRQPSICATIPGWRDEMKAQNGSGDTNSKAEKAGLESATT